MAEIDFFATDQERIEYLRPLFGRGFRFIPDLHFEKPAAPKLRGTDELLRYASKTSQFFIVNDKLLKSPLEYRRVEREGHDFYYIFPRSGGPLLLLFWGKHEKRNGTEVFGATTLSYYPWYEDSITHEKVKPSPEFVREYSDVARCIRAASRKVRPGVRAYWLTPTIEGRVRKGAVLIGLEAFASDQILSGHQ